MKRLVRITDKTHYLFNCIVELKEITILGQIFGTAFYDGRVVQVCLKRSQTSITPKMYCQTLFQSYSIKRDFS